MYVQRALLYIQPYQPVIVEVEEKFFLKLEGSVLSEYQP